MNKGDLINKVYQTDLSKRATLVIFYLINRADKEMTCFPGIKTIAKECNIGTRTVQRALNDLIEADFVIKESRFHEQGGQRTNLYTLLLEVEVREENDEITFDSYNTSDNNETNLNASVEENKSNNVVIRKEGFE